MAYSPEEKARRAAYKELLGKHGPYSPSSISSYMGPVSSKGELTAAVRGAGLLPPEAESLLAVTPGEGAKKIALWWADTGITRYKQHQTAMKLWLTLWLQQEDGAAPSAEPTDIPTPPTGREQSRTLILQPPPHGVRLLSLFQALFSRDTDADYAEGFYEGILRVLLLDPQFILDTNTMKEDSAAFQRLRRRLLYTSAAPADLHRAMGKEFPTRRWASQGREMVTRCLRTHAPGLLADLRTRNLPYEDSLLPCLDRLRKAGEETFPAALLGVVQRVLLDCDSTALTQGSPDTAALTDPRLWEDGLLLDWLEGSPPDGDSMEEVLLLPLPAEGELAGRLRRAQFWGMYELGTPARGGPQALNWLDRTDHFLCLHAPRLEPVLAQPGGRWPPVPAQELLGGAANCVFRARVLLQTATLALLPRPLDTPHQRGHRLMQCQQAVRLGHKILEKRLEEGQSAIHLLSGLESLYPLLFHFALCNARCHLALAQLEVEENCLADSVALYLRPARHALEDALDDLELLPVRERAPLKQQWSKVFRQCAQSFFANSPVLSRMGLRRVSDPQLYQEEFNAWKELAPDLLPPSAPVVVRPLDPQQLRDPTLFQPVYSGVFDSVSGKDPNHQQAVELMEFQLLASGKTSLLQMNQAVDNLAFLRLLPQPGLRLACRQGLITLSCYQNIHSPRDYLFQCLKDPGFRFSSSRLYDIPQVRQTMQDWLISDRTVTLQDFPAFCRDEVEFLMESYEVLFSCFQPADLLRHHQNNANRYPPRTTGQPVISPLPDVIDRRLDRLLRQARDKGQTQQVDTLLELRRFALHWHDVQTRSVYDTVIDQAIEQATPSDGILLEKFRKLVYQCYFLSNGRRSCDTILLTETDPDLTLDIDYNDNDPKNKQLADLFRQSITQTQRGTLGWPDICEVALNVREIDLKERPLSARKRARRMEEVTGVGYIVSGTETLAGDFRPYTSAGTAVHIAPTSAETAGETLALHKG